MLSFLNRTVIVIILGVIVFGALAYYKHKASSLLAENIKFKSQIQQLQTDLKSCQIANEELTKAIAIQKEQYQKKVAELIKNAQKPVKIIEIPKVIEKPVYIPTEDCQKMGVMIDEFIKIQKEHNN